MSRRVRLPAADDLFRPTVPVEPAPAEEPAAGAGERTEPPADQGDAAGTPSHRPSGRPSGRVRHDEKMTVYVTDDELLDLEHARLTLRRHHGLAVDRGRLVREAVAIALADLDAEGEDSLIVRRLQQ